MMMSDADFGSVTVRWRAQPYRGDMDCVPGTRRGGAAHCLYYTTGRLPDGAVGTIILRVLHEHMEPRYKVVRSLKSFA